MFALVHRRYLSVLALSLLLSLPGVAMASHLHESTPDEINCELCGHIGPVAEPETTHLLSATPKATTVEACPDDELPSTFLIHRYQRGPPLQH